MMQMDAWGKWLIKNGVTTPLAHGESINLPDGPRVYEVIRLLAGKPLFFADHFARLQQSAALLQLGNLPSQSTLSQWIGILVEKNQVQEINVRLEFIQEANGQVNIFVFFVPSSYPTKDMYQRGVPVGLFDWVRDNPLAKVWNSDYKTSVAQCIQKLGVYEVLLVDGSGSITEGSRSNVFWVKDVTIYTSPDDVVLGGVTRKHVLQVCGKIGLPLVKTSVPVKDVSGYQACFLCGTSPQVLPVSRVGTVELSSAENQYVRQIMDGFAKEVSDALNKTN